MLSRPEQVMFLLLQDRARHLQGRRVHHLMLRDPRSRPQDRVLPEYLWPGILGGREAPAPLPRLSEPEMRRFPPGGSRTARMGFDLGGEGGERHLCYPASSVLPCRSSGGAPPVLCPSSADSSEASLSGSSRSVVSSDSARGLSSSGSSGARRLRSSVIRPLPTLFREPGARPWG